MLDQAVAGGVARGEIPFEHLVREAREEVALSEGVVECETLTAGMISWFNFSDGKAGGALALKNPGVLYVYVVEVDPGLVFKSVDGDVQSFHLMSVVEVNEAMTKGEFKPSCAIIILDFLIRHGFITAENEKDYVEIVSRLHRKLPFKTSPGF